LDAKRYPMTEAGKDMVMRELADLKSVKRQKVIDRIKMARKFCDFREDSEYMEALEEQITVEKRIFALEEMLRNAEIIANSDSNVNTVIFGKSVTFIEIPSGEEETYTIVGSAEANPLNGTISNDSPIATNLLGRKVDDEVTLQTPGGYIKVRIIKIS
jgi:transcription elongation factor GreA